MGKRVRMDWNWERALSRRPDLAEDCARAMRESREASGGWR